jgi:hypothetical protein
MTDRYGYVVIPAWEYDIVAEEGIFSTGGVCIFVDKKDAIEWGTKNAQLLMPEEVVQVYVGNIEKEVPIIELYTSFYLASVDVDLLEGESNHAPELLADEDIPMVWYTKERIPTLCIVHTEQIPI